MVNESITLNIGYFTYSAGQEIDNVLFFKLGTQDVTFLHGMFCAVMFLLGLDRHIHRASGDDPQ
jgi:hypothetical protein